MFNKILHRLETLIVTSILCINIFAMLPNNVYAANPENAAKDAACEGAGVDCTQQDTKISQTVKEVITILSWIIGVSAVVVIMIAGLRFITASGDANSVSQARNMVLYASIGLVIVALAQVIVQFILTKTP